MRDERLSVVIPTRDRRAAVVRTLAALSRQRFDGEFEVIVSIDASTDDTAVTLQGLALPYPLKVVSSREPQGAAAARNRGAQIATSPLIVFLDDDIEASPGLLAAHAGEHRAGATLTIGYLPATTSTPTNFFHVALKSWWEAMFETMRRPGHRYTFRDVLTGNCAIDARLFHSVGGFDERFRCHEDFELGVRTIESGAVVRFVPWARGLHHECTTLARAFVRKVDEGRADVAMIRKHPALVTVLPLGVFEQYATRAQSLLRRLVFERPSVGRVLARALTRSLAPMESARLRGRWQRRLHELLHYWYWRGVRDEVQSFQGLRTLLEECRSKASGEYDWADVDLAGGLHAAMGMLDARRPQGVRVHYADQRVGEMGPAPGAERLRGAHLQGALARELAGPLVAALGRAGVISVTRRAGVLKASGALPAQAGAL